MDHLVISGLVVKDIRFPTSLEKHGSDAMHTDPDYSCAYVILQTNNWNLNGHGLSFTIGKGTEVVVKAVEGLYEVISGKRVEEIVTNFALYWRRLTSHSQMRWIGPEKGVIHLAAGVIVNAIWDLWARIEGKPLWKLLIDLDPEKLVSTIDFRYITDILTKEEAIKILKSTREDDGYRKRTMKVLQDGYPAYTTSIGWLGYDESRVRQLCKAAIDEGYSYFKIKVGENIDEDKKRLKIIREEIGFDRNLMVDANQCWDVDIAIEWMKELAQFKPLWIEEPTSADDALGHSKIAKALEPLGIKVATGEHCQNRVMFKQFMQLGGMQYCQVDACRIGGVNEVLAVVLMAKKMNIPVCPHAGGVGLCEYVRHISMWDYVAVSGTFDDRVTEYVNHLHDIFEDPAYVLNGFYKAPESPGYCGVMKAEVMDMYEYPHGEYWKNTRE